MIAMALLPLLLLVPQNAPPQMPTVGTDVDQSYEIVLPTSFEGPAVSVRAQGVAIRIPRLLLEEIAAEGRDSWNTEEERQTKIAASRAKTLLEKADATSPGTEASLADGALDDSQYLVAQILDAGKAVIVPDGAREPVGRIMVRYLGVQLAPLVGFGDIFFLLVEPRVGFFSVRWFVS